MLHFCRTSRGDFFAFAPRRQGAQGHRPRYKVAGTVLPVLGSAPVLNHYRLC